jgi:hypothetical protein
MQANLRNHRKQFSYSVEGLSEHIPASWTSQTPPYRACSPKSPGGQKMAKNGKQIAKSSAKVMGK